MPDDKTIVGGRLFATDEAVVGDPPKMSARARMFATGQGRKTDETQAHSVTLVGTRMSGLRPVVKDDQLAALRTWSIDDAARRMTTGPGGQLGNVSDSSATGSQPNAGSSDQSRPGPVRTTPRPALPRSLDAEASHERAAC